MQELLKNSAELLKSVRAELHGSVDDSVLEQFDSVIRDLETAQEKHDKGQTIEIAKLLVSFGILVSRIPELAQAIKALIELIKNTPNH